MTSPRILIVDDNKDICRSLKVMLEREGYEVECAYDGAGAMRIQSQRPSQVLITDLMMPERDGLETIAHFKRDYPGVRVIAMSGGGTGLGGEKYLFTAGVAGAEVMLEKPFGPTQLLAAVRRVAPTDPSR